MGMVTGDPDRDTAEATRRILVVDDEPMIATVVADYLEAADEQFDVTQTTTPTAALERLDDSFDCVVTDYEMPQLDGLGLIEAAETDAQFVVFSAVDDETIARRVKDAGATFVRKGSGAEPYRDLLAHVRARIAG